MGDINITFPDGNIKKFASGTSALDIANSISEGLARECVVASVNEELVDLTKPINEDAKLELIKFDDPRGKEVFWHSSAHLLAQAVLRLYPESKPTIGPPLEEGGFYYDFANLTLKEEDLPKIEEEMIKAAKENFPSERIEYSSKDEPNKQFGDNKFKLEIIGESDENLSAYKQGEFIDLCRGPHIPRTGMVKAVWLHKLSGAYWRADSNNEQLTRVYGITYPDKKLLKEYKTRLEEAQKRDHRALGKKLDLYGFEEVSPGSPFFYPKGTVVYNELLKFLREEYEKRGYQEVITPLLYEKSLWEQSGHWEHYKDNMFIMQDGDQTFSLKPMNCPSHCLIYNRGQHSYRDLPIRIADFAPLHRNELRGTLGGLTRVRKLSQDDAHHFCRPDQIKQEIQEIIDFNKFIYVDVMKMEFDHVELSTRPDKFLGEIKDWNEAENALKLCLDESGLSYQVNEGDGAFYGPKIDFHIKDALGRTWQTTTIQLDFQLPQRFECIYLGEDSQKHTTVMIHRALLGSLERFIGVLIEHYAGKLPIWLAPVQVKLLPIADRHADYANKIAEMYSANGIRAEVDERQESLNRKVREAQINYVPYILVVGDKELEDKSVNIRTRENEQVGSKSAEDFMKQVLTIISNRD